MLYHKYDPTTSLYVESIESEEQPEHSVAGNLPDQTEHYTLAHVDGSWVSVLRPKYEIVDNQIRKIAKEEPVAIEQPVTPAEE